MMSRHGAGLAADREDAQPRAILVLGATGTHGGPVARALIASGRSVSGLTRDPRSPRALALQREGARLIVGDLDDPGSIAGAMRGVDACYAVTTPFEAGSEEEVRQGENVISAAEESGLSWLVMASVASAREADVPHFASKARIERSLESSGLNWTIVAPKYFYEDA